MINPVKQIYCKGLSYSIRANSLYENNPTPCVIRYINKFVFNKVLSQGIVRGRKDMTMKHRQTAIVTINGLQYAYT